MRWRTCNNRRRRKPWWLKPRYLGVIDGAHMFIVQPRLYRDLQKVLIPIPNALDSES